MNEPASPTLLQRRHPARWASAGLLAMLAACGGGTADPWADRLPELAGATALNWADGTYRFTTEQAWSDAWKATPLYLPAPGQPHPALPSVDWVHRMVVGVAVTGSNGCASVGIVGAEETTTEVVVRYRVVQTPPPGVACTAALVRLVHFTDIAASAKPVVFQRQGG